MDFADQITTEDELRAILRPPRAIVADKAIDHIDEHCASFITQSPFVVIASSDGQGHFDLSPKGDPPGFVRMLDTKTLAIPERPGNHRADTFTNVLKDPAVGMIFLVPGVKTTLRVSGRARIVADATLLESMALDGPRGRSVPKLALVVDVEEAMLHCAKCIIRSGLWDHSHADDAPPVADLAEAMVDQGQLDLTVDELREIITADEQKNLY